MKFTEGLQKEVCRNKSNSTGAFPPIRSPSFLNLLLSMSLNFSLNPHLNFSLNPNLNLHLNFSLNLNLLLNLNLNFTHITKTHLYFIMHLLLNHKALKTYYKNSGQQSLLSRIQLHILLLLQKNLLLKHQQLNHNLTIPHTQCL